MMPATGRDRSPRSPPTETLITEEALARRVRELGKELCHDYLGRVPIVVGILKGSIVFLGDLIRNMSIDLEVDFISIASYGDGVRSSGSVKLLKDLDRDIEGRDVLIVEDIVDSGLSLSYLRRILGTRGPRSLSIVALLDKRERRTEGVYVDYVGFEIPDKFVVGYGLDYAEQYRGLPYVAVLSEHEVRAAAERGT